MQLSKSTKSSCEFDKFIDDIDNLIVSKAKIALNAETSLPAVKK